MRDYHGQTDYTRHDHLFAFDSHYALARQYAQRVQAHGHNLVVLEALKCVSPQVNNGEDNAEYKSLVGTLYALWHKIP